MRSSKDGTEIDVWKSRIRGLGFWLEEMGRKVDGFRLVLLETIALWWRRCEQKLVQIQSWLRRVASWLCSSLNSEGGWEEKIEERGSHACLFKNQRKEAPIFWKCGPLFELKPSRRWSMKLQIPSFGAQRRVKKSCAQTSQQLYRSDHSRKRDGTSIDGAISHASQTSSVKNPISTMDQRKLSHEINLPPVS